MNKIFLKSYFILFIFDKFQSDLSKNDFFTIKANTKTNMSISTEQNILEITKSLVYKTKNSDEISMIEKQKEDLMDMIELDNSEDYTQWIIPNAVFKSNDLKLLVLNIFGRLIGVKLVDEKEVPKRTVKKTKKSEEQSEENDTSKDDTFKNDVKMFGGYYLSMVDLAAGFEVSEKDLKSWATMMDKHIQHRKIIENSNWLHISILPAFLTTFMKDYRDVVAEMFNTMLFTNMDIDTLRVNVMRNKKSKQLGRGFSIKSKELKAKTESTGPDAYKIILITIHKDDGFIAIDTAKASSVEKTAKTKSKNGTYPIYRIPTEHSEIATTIIKNYLIDVKKLNPVNELNGKKTIGTNIIYYSDNLPETEKDVKAIFDEFTEDYIKAHLTTSKTTKAKKPQAQTTAKVSAPKKQTKSDKSDKNDKKTKAKSKAKEDDSEESENTEEIKPAKQLNSSQKAKVIQEDDEDESDEQFNW